MNTVNAEELNPYKITKPNPVIHPKGDNFRKTIINLKHDSHK